MKKLFASVLFVALTFSLHAVVQAPYTLGVNFSFQISGTGNGILSVYDDTGTSPTVAVTTIGTTTESPQGIAWLRPGKSYSLLFQASGPGSFGLSFIAPDGYTVYLNGSPADMINVTGQSGGYHYTYSIQLMPVSSSVRTDAGSFSGIELGKSITWEAGLGGLRNGSSAGKILFKQLDLVTNAPASRQSLYYAAPPNNSQITTVYTGSSTQALRQVMAPQALADLVDDTGGNGYLISFYAPSQATWNGTLYTISSGATAFRTIHVVSPATNQLLITETDSGPSGTLTRVSSLELTSGSISTGNFVLTLQEGDGTTWLRTTTHTSTANSDGSRDDVVVVNPPGPGSTVATKTKFHYSYPGVLVSGQSDTCNYNSSTFPLTATTGQAVSFTANVTNTGNNNWGTNHYVVLRDSSNNNLSFASTSGIVSGASTTCTLSFTAPSTAGTYVYYIQGLDNTVVWFPTTATVTLNVTNGSTSTGQSDTCNYTASNFPLTSAPGGTLNFTTSLTNTGTNTWGSNHYLVLRDASNNNLAFASLSGVAPGGTTTVSLSAAAATTLGVATYHIQALDNGITWFPTYATVSLNVTTIGWGEELLQVVADPDGAKLTTSFTYNTNISAYGNYRKIQAIVYPTGNWHSSAYYDDWWRRGQLQTESRPYINSPATAQAANLSVGDSATYTYTSDFSGRWRNETSRQSATTNIQTGQRSTTPSIGLSRYGQSYTTYTTNDYASASLSQQTYSEVMDPTGLNADYFGQILCVKRPDQSEDSYAYYYGSLNGSNQFVASSGGATATSLFATVVWHGSSSSSGADLFTSSAMYSGATISSVYLLANKSTMEVSVRNPAGLVVRNETWLYLGSSTFSATPISYTNYTYDAAGRLLTQVANNGATNSNTYGNGLLTASFDTANIETDFQYDSLHRVLVSTKKGTTSTFAALLTPSYSYQTQADIPTTYTYDGANNITQQVVGTVSATLTTNRQFDPSGRLIQEIAPGNYTTGWAYGSGGLVTTVTLPGTATKIITNNLDGQLQQIGGSGVVSQSLTYAIDSSTGNRLSQLISGGISAAWTNTYADWLGRKIQEWKPQWDGNAWANQWYYNANGELYKVSQPNLAPKLYGYDSMGVMFQECVDINGNGVIDTGGTDRVTQHSWGIYTWDGGATYWRRQLNSVYATLNSGTTTPTNYVDTQVSGFAAGVISKTNSYDQYGNFTSTSVNVTPANKIVDTVTVFPNSTTSSHQVVYNGLNVESEDGTAVIMRYEYDALGRKIHDIDPRTGSTITAYVPGSSFVLSVTDPAGTAQATYSYDTAGRVATVTNGLAKICRYNYDSHNNKYQVWGDTDFPVQYGYDSLDRLTSQSTFRGGSNWNGTSWPTSTTGTADTTSWGFHAATGLLKTKTDAASNPPVTYTYTVARQIATRTWSRGVVTTYGYDASTGELTGVTYSDSTPTLGYTYNRLGKPATVADYSGTRTFNYNLSATLELQNEQLGSFYGTAQQLTYLHDTTGTGTKGRLTAFEYGTTSNPAAGSASNYNYDTFGRLSGVAGSSASTAAQTFTYSYTPNSHLVSGITDTAANYSDVRIYDPTHDWIASRVDTSATTGYGGGFTYAPDAIGRSQHVTKLGTILNAYGNGTQGLTTTWQYDDKSEVTSESTTITGGSALPGRNDSYQFDTIGNRTSAVHNGNSSTYSPTNSLNQYSQRTVPGYYDVAGFDSAATVTVNGTTTLRAGQYFFLGYGMNNNPNPIFSTLTINNGTSSKYWPAFLQGTPEYFSYDNDGNLTGDGRWTYSYDAENRPSTIQTNSAAVAAGVPRIAINFAYDYLGRRATKVAYSWSGSAWVQQYQQSFVYNGWNIAKVIDSTTTDKYLFWGLDLSNSLEGAGGVGGLLQIQDSGNSYLPVYDGYGSIYGLLKASDGSVAATYEYDAFGNTLREFGSYADSNAVRYSSKYTDLETNLIYYGLRYYSPSLGRFINKDPIEEKGGLNLYGFCRNNAINGWDNLGMYTAEEEAALNAYYKSRFDNAHDAGSFSGLDLINASMYGGEDTNLYSVGGYGYKSNSLTPPPPPPPPPDPKTVAAAQQTLTDAGFKTTVGTENGQTVDYTITDAQGNVVVDLGLERDTGNWLNVASSTSAQDLKSNASIPNNSGNTVIIVTPGGNAVPVPPGGTLGSSPNGKWIGVKNADGTPGVRIDDGHIPQGPNDPHNDPRAQGPHAHVPGVTNPDGTPWLPVNPEPAPFSMPYISPQQQKNMAISAGAGVAVGAAWYWWVLPTLVL